MRETLHQAEADRIRAIRHHDRNRTRSLAHRQVGWHGRRHNHAWIESDQLLRQSRKAIEETVGVAVFEATIASFDVTELTQSGAKRVVTRCHGRRRRTFKYSDERTPRLLRPCG